MTRKLISLILAIGFSTFVHAGKTLMINGEKAERDDVSTITFAEDELELRYSDGSTFKLDIETVEINFSVSSGTDGVPTNTFSVNTLVEDHILLSGLEKGSQVQIIRTDGKVLFSTVAEESELTIHTDKMSPAPYLIKVGNQFVKIIKK